MGKITVVGLGPGSEEHVTLAALEAMKHYPMVYLRTQQHPTVSLLDRKGIPYSSFDFVYEEMADFDAVYDEIVNLLVEKSEKEEVLYAVPGHPNVAEVTVQRLKKVCDDRGIHMEIQPAMSFLDVMLPVLGVDPVDGFKLIDGLQLDQQEPDPSVANIITQVYDPFMASQIKLRLMDYYHDEQEIFVVRGAGIPTIQRIEKILLYELDRLDWIDYLTSVYIPKIDSMQKKYYNMNNLVDIMERLRNKDGCPWDIQQTHKSLKPYLIEESYEVLEAIDLEDDFLLEEELGDLLLQVVFHSQIAKERQAFSINDVIGGISEKLIFRHPHVFKDVKADNLGDALETWEERKRQEKKIESYTESMESIPQHLPALMKAFKIQKKAAGVGFDWDKSEEVINKIHEELSELKDATEEGHREKMLEEGGDLLFAVVNLLRFLDLDPEEALNSTSRKFISRFSYIEKAARESGGDLKDMTLEEMEELWQLAKTEGIHNFQE
ncbi:bifunctional methyltransferase/pyrophosphohydrolase YabN [Alkaliphilus hydrothermalis]|uniref:Tetrapyrrole methylase family protein/MazG family protein n=1 Tax=Alkaliphilus hydrothermalis TaxID=1482730 RepID=A0ABS2NPC6_9FIRM|nr:nucleoside triphosphate pyrophosphohydrolase [Alkaliphilus hydrothermalis]MBM7614785.1 tetrapyrrole methylase family protein/MazG family protein [Alkaliphilus hydrothermalis]